MSFYNETFVSDPNQPYEVMMFNNTAIDSNSSQHGPLVPSSLQWTRFVTQTVLTPVIVIVGLLGNVLNILVLLQPSMRTSTNIYILVLSLADCIFLAFNFALSFLPCRSRGLSDAAYYFNPYGRFLSNFSGNVAVWVTVSFTVERYIAVCHPMKGKVWCTVRRAKIASLAVTLLALINTLPTFFELRIENTDTGLKCTSTELAESIVYSWWYVTVFTFIPLVCLALFNIVLIRALVIASKKRQKLVMNQSGSMTRKGETKPLKANRNSFENGKNGSQRNMLRNVNDKRKLSISKDDSNSLSQNYCTQKKYSLGLNHHNGSFRSQVSTTTTSTCSPNKNIDQNQTASDSRRQSNSSSSQTKFGDKTSAGVSVKRQNKRMSREQHKVNLLLITIVMIFLFCQLPWTALFLYTIYLDNNQLSGNRTHIKIAGNICNLLGLVNSSVNFYLYSCFSKKFRQTLKASIMFWRKKSNGTPVNF